MKIIETDLLDCYIIEPNKFGDDRGYFSPCFVQKDFDVLGFKGVVQTNRSMSGKGVVRGLHFQEDPKSQAKIVEVLNGSVVDVVVDMRVDSDTYGKHTTVLLTADNNRQLFVPRGFAHGFVSLEENTLFQYFVDNEYAPNLESGILWNDPELAIDWQGIFDEYDIDIPILTDRDLKYDGLSKCKVKFYRGER